ncbi:MAG TPA: redoxin domain-containing protein [Candidatus Aquilonibacter sp.]|nr:redoxin domain-containing protein [Candidatus Aquilonibacter sp.]
MWHFFVQMTLSSSKHAGIAFVSGIAFCFFLVFSPVSCAQDDAQARQILTQAADKYRALKSYQAQIAVDTIQGTKTSDRHFTETGAGSAFRCADDDPQGLLRVNDGSTEWTLDRKTDRYSRSPAADAAPSLISDLANVDKNVKGAEILREDLYSLGNEKRKVLILEVVRDRWPADAPRFAQDSTVRIDEQTLEIYGINTYTNGATIYDNGPTQIVRYSLTQQNQTAAASLFTFSPPAGAEEVASLDSSPAATASVLGTDAPDFALSDAGGHSYHLADLRGKVVVIDFWASWCPPCRASMPYLQQISQGYADRGAIVLGLDGGEDAQTVADFAKTNNYTFPLLVGGEPRVTSQYYVDAYPTTLVIDRNGKIVFREDGMDSPRPLIVAVQKALAGKN